MDSRVFGVLRRALTLGFFVEREREREQSIDENWAKRTSSYPNSRKEEHCYSWELEKNNATHLFFFFFSIATTSKAN